MMMREETLSSSHPPAYPGHHRRSCDHCSPDTGDNIVLRPESDHGHHMRHGTLEDSPEASSPPLHAAMVSGQCLHSPVNIFDSQKSNKVKKLFKDISNFSKDHVYRMVKVEGRCTQLTLWCRCYHCVMKELCCCEV